MDLFSSIRQRKSSRKYNMQPLPQDVLAAMEKAIGGFMPLYPSVPLSHRITARTKGLMGAQSPHYLIVSGNGAEGELENAGFL